MNTIAKLRELEARATRGPWKWRNCVGSQGVALVSPPGGLLYVMEARRHGLNSADIVFAERTDNMGGILKKATELLPKPGRGVSDYPPVTNPDMAMVAAARNALPALLAIAEAAKMESDHRNGRGPRLDPEVVYINLDKALTQLDEVEL